MKKNKKFASLALVTLLAPSLLNAQYVFAEEVQTEAPVEQQEVATEKEEVAPETPAEEKQPEVKPEEETSKDDTQPEGDKEPTTKPEADDAAKEDSKPEADKGTEAKDPAEKDKTDKDVKAANVTTSFNIVDEAGVPIGAFSYPGTPGETLKIPLLDLEPKKYEILYTDNEAAIPVADAKGQLGVQLTVPDAPALITIVVRAYEGLFSGNVYVTHIDDLGNELTQSVTTLSGFVGEEYTTEAQNIPGYILIEEPANANGTFTEEDQTVVYRYDRVETTVSVVCVDENGTALGKTVSQAGKFKDTFTITAPEIPGYEYLGISPVAYSNASNTFEGSYGLEDQSFVANYKKIEEPIVEPPLPPQPGIQTNTITNVSNVLTAPVVKSEVLNKKLPETGEAEINSTIASMGLVLIAGVYFTKKKREDEFSL